MFLKCVSMRSIGQHHQRIRFQTVNWTAHAVIGVLLLVFHVLCGPRNAVEGLGLQCRRAVLRREPHRGLRSTTSFDRQCVSFDNLLLYVRKYFRLLGVR